jgi:tetratricopeptide (TPR) repeat protein
VNHRKFSWWNTHFSYAGVRDSSEGGVATADYDDGKWDFTGNTTNVSGELKEIPDLPITTMASSQVELRVADGLSDPPEQKASYLPEDERRWNYYGVGLLLQRDFLAAEQIFRRLTEISPEFAEAWINLGRSRLLLGRPDEAWDSLLEASKLRSDAGKVNFFLGITAKDQGDYIRALDYLRKAETVYPRDRRILYQLGKTLLLLQRYQDAIEVLKRAVEIDPEDSQVHSQLSRCYEAVGNQAEAQRELQLHQRFRQQIAAPFGSAPPEDENERHPIHLHDSFPLEELASGIDPV